MQATIIRQEILTLAKKMEDQLKDTEKEDPNYTKKLVQKLYGNVEGKTMENRVKNNPDLFKYRGLKKGNKKLKSHELSVE